MALKDLKSDLSKFRMPKKDPLVDKKIDSVNTKTNQTPLSSMVDSAPKIPRSQTTTNKEGVSPRKFDNSSQFLGETTPNKIDNSSKFLGETTPSKMDNSENFLGETTPTRFDNSSNFLGETTPNKSDISSKFLGETTPVKSNLEEQFLGETTPSKFDNSSNFLGETTPTPTNNESGFLGETTPSKFDNSSNFLGETTPKPANNQLQFLGETTPIPANNQSQFLGETTPSSIDNTGQFLGETTPKNSNNQSSFLGETTPNVFNFNPNHSDRATTPTDVNYFQDIHATGFNSKFGGIESSKFIGVNPNNTVFDGTTSLYSNINDSTFSLGKTYGDSFNSTGGLKSGETGFGIGKSQAQRQSPSFLDLQYAKFNLKDDAYNTGLGLFRHPLILRGIQRKGISKGEPQSWGVLGVTFDDGLIRGGAITSTVRAAIDTARIGAWMASIPGLLWGIKQFGLQQSNPNVETVTGKRLTKIWTPVNTLASVLGQHIGLHPRRHGLLPLPEKVGPEKYESVQKAKAITHRLGGDTALGLPPTGNRLVGLYNESFLITKYGSMSTLSNGLPFLTLQGLGGPNSLYGLIPGGKVPTRNFNTIPNDIGNSLNPINTIQNQYNPIGNDSLKSKIVAPFDGGGSNKLDSNGSSNNQKNAAETIKDYTTLSYSQIKTISDGKTANEVGNLSKNDFRSKSSSPIISKRAELENYDNNNVNKRVNFGDSGKLGLSEDRIEWWKTQRHDGNENRFDAVNALDLGQSANDLVHLWFQAEGGQKVQFRGTVKGITETFSPSWDTIKYNGRADQAYKYTTFERSISFNFQVYATSRIEMKPIWRKLQYLSTMTMPQYGGENGYQGTLVRFRLGSLYKGKLAFIESLSYNMSDETPWEISMLDSNEPIGELPMGIDVSIGLKILGDNRPQLAQKVYDWNF